MGGEASSFSPLLGCRVDGKEAPLETHQEQKNERQGMQRALRDAKDTRLIRSPRNGIIGHLHACPEAPTKVRQPSTGSGVSHPPYARSASLACLLSVLVPLQFQDAALQEETPSDDSLSESVSSQHFASKSGMCYKELTDTVFPDQ